MVYYGQAQVRRNNSLSELENTLDGLTTKQAETTNVPWHGVELMGPVFYIPFEHRYESQHRNHMPSVNCWCDPLLYRDSGGDNIVHMPPKRRQAYEVEHDTRAQVRNAAKREGWVTRFHPTSRGFTPDNRVLYWLY